jgi:hypothetical protein
MKGLSTVEAERSGAVYTEGQGLVQSIEVLSGSIPGESSWTSSIYADGIEGE